MAKTKQRNTSVSAAQRREQMRKQQPSSNQSRPSQTRGQNVRRRVARRSPWLLIGGILLGIALLVGIFLYLANQQSNGVVQGKTDATVLKMVTTVKPSVLAEVRTGGVQNSLKGTPVNTPLLKGPKGKPEFFYYGAEFCPYCAAQRWAVVVALSRFGTFTQLLETTSSSTDSYPNTATFTFYHSEYTSPYIDFVPLEAQDRQGGTLQTPTADQQQLLNRYQVNGYPFTDIADRYLISGPMYSPDILTGLSQKDIASQLANPGSNVTQNILGSANYLTAALCATTQNQPASVCTADPIPSIEKSLSQTALGPGSALVRAGTKISVATPVAPPQII